MKGVHSYKTPGQAALTAARGIGQGVREAVAARGVCSVAFSGGRSPLDLFAALLREEIPWHATHVFQVDERVAPGGSEQRNWTGLLAGLLNHVDIPATHIHPMPVEAGDLDKAALDYQEILRSITGEPPVLDIVHLGLGADGHTASLVPNDAVLDETRNEVAITAAYQGNRRMTLTLPCLKRARQVVWLVTGSEKSRALARMLANDPEIPAGRICHDHQTVYTDLALTEYSDDFSGRRRNFPYRGSQ